MNYGISSTTSEDSELRLAPNFTYEQGEALENQPPGIFSIGDEVVVVYTYDEGLYDLVGKHSVVSGECQGDSRIMLIDCGSNTRRAAGAYEVIHAEKYFGNELSDEDSNLLWKQVEYMRKLLTL